MCLAAGRAALATVVDHKTPLALGGTDDDANTRNLCDEHHRAVTADQFGLARHIGLGGCGTDGRPTDPAHPWNRT